jgi:RNA polymerase sigma-70 factor (ECF subfamily)
MPEVASPNGDAAPDDDETLVRLARNGSPSAQDALFQRHRGVAYRVAFRLLGHEQDALDAVQDGLVKAFLALKEFDGRSGFRTWFVRIVHNAAIDVGRKRGRRAALGLGVGHGPARGNSNGDGESHHPDPSVNDDPARGLHRQDLRHALDTALARLNPPVRMTFILFAEGGLSYEEIAETQKIPIGTVMSRLHYARHKLKSFSELQGIE